MELTRFNMDDDGRRVTVKHEHTISPTLSSTLMLLVSCIHRLVPFFQAVLAAIAIYLGALAIGGPAGHAVSRLLAAVFHCVLGVMEAFAVGVLTFTNWVLPKQD
jgi:hypothetical protein